MKNIKNTVSKQTKFKTTFRKPLIWYLILTLSITGLLGWRYLSNRLTLEKAKGSNSQIQLLLSCNNTKEPSSKIKCEEEIIQNILNTEGVGAALEAVAKVSESDKDFINSCHGFAHQIGQSAYKLFKNKTNFKISPTITYCNYGFYHGFMETMLQDSGDYQKARDFCDYINNQLVQYGLNLAGECYHGIGHGTVDQHDPKQWTNPTLATQQSIQLCHKLATNESHLVDCASGVFNGIANFYAAGQYGLKVNEQDPFWLCTLQENAVKKTCYAFMARTLFPSTGSDLSKAIDLAAKTAPSSYLGTVISNLTVLKPNPDNTSWQEIVSICRSVTQTAIKECLRGYAIGLLQSGQPGKEYQNPINFCKSELLTPEEKQMCFENILTQLKNYYPKDKLEPICQSVDKSYRHLCI